MMELATWNRSQGALVDRADSPWDDAERRNFLRRAILAKDFYDDLWDARITTKIIHVLEKLMRLAA